MPITEFESVFSFWAQCIGVIAWTISSTILALTKRMDAVGVFFSVMTTVFGGGIIRDLCIGRLPPAVFVEKEFLYYILIAVVTSVISIILLNIQKISQLFMKHSNGLFINAADALGMAIFCITGVNACIAQGQTGLLLMTFAGGMTGCGGGILRDIFTAEVPMIFRKHIYALPAFVGSFLYAWLCKCGINRNYTAIGVIFAIITVRVLAAKFKWNLPSLYHPATETEKVQEKQNQLR